MQNRIDKPAPNGTSVLSVRVTPEERALLEAASDQSRTSLSEFVRRKAIEAAEIDVLERTVVSIPARDWAKFEAWVSMPAKSLPGIERLARKSPTWQK